MTIDIEEFSNSELSVCFDGIKPNNGTRELVRLDIHSLDAYRKLMQLTDTEIVSKLKKILNKAFANEKKYIKAEQLEKTLNLDDWDKDKYWDSIVDLIDLSNKKNPLRDKFINTTPDIEIEFY